MDSDRVLVMDKGEVAEFDHPYTLLSKPDSHLNFMVKETGDSMSNALLQIAKTKYFSEDQTNEPKSDWNLPIAPNIVLLITHDLQYAYDKNAMLWVCRNGVMM